MSETGDARSNPRSDRDERDEAQRLVDVVPVPMAVVSVEGRLLALNERFTSTFGYAAEDVATLSAWWERAFPDPAYRAEVIAAWAAMTAGRGDGAQVGPVERWITCKGGDRLTAEVSGIALLGKVFVTFVDLTERRRAEAELLDARALAEAVFQSTEDLIWSVDARDFRLLTFNRAIARHFLNRYGVEMKVGATPREILRSDDSVALWRGIYERALREGAYRMPLLARDGVTHLDVRVSPVRVGGEVRAIAVFGRDVTEQRSAEAMLRHSQKLESVGRLAGGVAHDFNNMLAAILANAVEVRGSLARGERVDPESVDEILEAGRRAAGVTRQLLAFARKGALRPEIVDVGAAVRDVLKLLRRVLGDEVVVQEIHEPAPWSVWLIPGQLGQVIMNLAVNARDAMPGGGTLTVSTANVELPERLMGVGSDVGPGPCVRLTVADTGCGMTHEVMEHLFEPFFTTKEQGKGTGLGLATVFGIVKQAGGCIRVASEPGRGSRFEVYLPRAEEARTQAAGDPALRTPATPGGETVLVVADDPQVLRATVRSLQRSGFDVLPARTLDEALRRVESHPVPPEVLVTDVRIPGASGPEVSAALARKHPGIRSVFISGEPGDPPSGSGAELTRIVAKPFSVDQLVAAVREALRS